MEMYIQVFQQQHTGNTGDWLDNLVSVNGMDFTEAFFGSCLCICDTPFQDTAAFTRWLAVMEWSTSCVVSLLLGRQKSVRCLYSEFV